MMTADTSAEINLIAGDLESLRNAVEGSRELRRFIESPILSVEKKRSVFRELFHSRLNKTTMAFLELLVEKQREENLLGIIEQFLVLRDAKYGIVNVEVASAVEITTQQEKNLSEKLEHYTRKKVRIRFSLDNALQGGLVVRIGDTVLDASIKRQLELMREQFAGGYARN
jgi:F-type H+-transporting ATPase subunit delta